MLQEFVRKFVAAGGKIHSGSDPNHVPAWLCGARGAGDADRSRSDAATSDSNRQHQRRAGVGKDKDYGSVEKGKIADLVIVRGDPLQNISATQDVEMVFIEGKSVDCSFHPDYKNPIPRPIEDRPEQ